MLDDELLALTLNAPATRQIVQAVSTQWPDHGRYIKKTLSQRDSALMATTEGLAQAIVLLVGDKLPKIAEHYHWTCDRLREEELYFHRQGHYRLSTFAEADAEVYSDAAYMEKYMDGLLFSQVLWFNHVASCQFFLSQTADLLNPKASYLEIGPGHGLMMYLALRDFDLGSSTAWDLSQVSLDQTRHALAVLGQTGCQFAIQNVMELPPGTPPHDLVVLSEVLEHLQDPMAVMGHIRQLVNPKGGLIFINVPINSPSPDHLYLMRSPDDARALLTNTGFEILREGFFATQGMELLRALRNQVSVSACLLARRV